MQCWIVRIMTRLYSSCYFSFYDITFTTGSHAKFKISGVQRMLCVCLQEAEEYAELPMRHNEDQLNSELAQRLPLQVNPHSYDSAHTKTHLLMQAHFSRAQEIYQSEATRGNEIHSKQCRLEFWQSREAMLDVVANEGWLVSVMSICSLVQMIIQARWLHDSSLLTLPHIQKQDLYHIRMISEGSCDTEDCSDDAENAALHHTNKLHFKIYSNRKHSFQIIIIIFHSITLFTRKQDSKAQAPCFPKPKDEGWFLVLGEVEKKELLAIKRVGFIRNHSSVSVAFYTPERTGKCIYTLYLMSDSYLGLDLQYDILLNVIPASNAAQVNSEISGRH
uniref:SEC63 domain-containing protein n=1 Tax=Sinocyclocheilus rhinocerous TaxID=307959 RepID=A0A673JLY9_9TELE